MRELLAERVRDAVARLCVEANLRLPEDVRRALAAAAECEPFEVGRTLLDSMTENYKTAECEGIPICQDTGAACVFLRVGQDLYIKGDLTAAVNEGVRRGYCEGKLRKSMVRDPLDRVNTGDNTPAILYTEIIPGDRLEITVAPKGFGSENMSAVRMLRPSDGVEGVKKFVLDTVKAAGPNPCPPIVVGVGIGGTFDKAAYLAKHALTRPLCEENESPYYRALEEELLAAINALGIGPQGFGGRTTALGVKIEVMPTHIAGLPVAVNIGCHVTRHAREVL